MKTPQLLAQLRGGVQKMAKTKDTRAVIYARYSSHAQRDASIEQQVEACTAYARAGNFRVVDIYADRAVSGRTDRRADFQRMMRDAEVNRFKFVIAWKSNRMGRNMLQAMINEARLNDLGVRVLYTEEDFDDTAAGRFALRSMMNVNQFYSENMAEDIRRGLRDNAMNGKITNGQLPYGYKKGPDGKYAIDEPRAEIVREIFRRVAAGEKQRAIADDLNVRGIHTGRGKPWGRGSFQVILTNERYTGVYVYDDVRVEGGVPQIVSKELFDEVQLVLRRRKSQVRSAGDYLLTGKLFCGECKRPMVGKSGTSRNGDTYYYYACRGRLEHICTKAHARRDLLEPAVARAICDYALQDNVLQWISDSTAAYLQKKAKESPVSALKDELAQVERQIMNILHAIEEGIFTSSTKGRLEELERQKAMLEERIEAERCDLAEISRDDILRGLRLFRKGDIADRRYIARLFDTFLLAVYLYDDKIRLIFSFNGGGKPRKTIDVPVASLFAREHSCSTKPGLQTQQAGFLFFLFLLLLFGRHGCERVAGRQSVRYTEENTVPFT